VVRRIDNNAGQNGLVGRGSRGHKDVVKVDEARSLIFVLATKIERLQRHRSDRDVIARDREHSRSP